MTARPPGGEGDAAPGVPPGAPPGAPATSRDSFHRGAFEVLQPRDGHRAGSDALLLAASLPRDAAGSLADLGAGVGVAALAALSANPRLRAVLVEIDDAMARLAGRSLALPSNAALAKRCEILRADATLTGRRREEARLGNDSFDHVIMNPPYNSQSYRRPADPLKALAHVMGDGGLEPWMRTASAILRPGGMLHLIYRSERLGEIIASAQGRFGDLAILPLHAHAGVPASRVIARAVRGSRAPLSILPGIVLHNDDNSPTDIADAALNGRARLFP